MSTERPPIYWYNTTERKREQPSGEYHLFMVSQNVTCAVESSTRWAHRLHNSSPESYGLDAVDAGLCM